MFTFINRNHVRGLALPENDNGVSTVTCYPVKLLTRITHIIIAYFAVSMRVCFNYSPAISLAWCAGLVIGVLLSFAGVKL